MRRRHPSQARLPISFSTLILIAEWRRVSEKHFTKTLADSHAAIEKPATHAR